MDHPALLGTITRRARTVAEPSHVLRELDGAIARALGEGGEPGPAFLDFPTDTLRAAFPAALALPEQINSRPPSANLPGQEAIGRAADLLLKARRPLVVSGRGARKAAAELSAFLDRLDAVYLDTGESRGLVPDEHPFAIASMRGRAMREADLVVTVGRRLDFQLAYGSPAVFEKARFIRVADCAGELRDNRRGEVELFGTPALILDALREAMGNRVPEHDRGWIDELRAGHMERAARLKKKMRETPAGSDGRMHPDRLLAAIQDHIGSDSIMVIDGGDFLSFARVGLSARTMLDPGPFGCIGVGVPYGIAASLARPDMPVVVATGDGAFGFNAIEIDTAVRHRAPVVIVIANNGAWQIEVHDQAATHGKIVGTRLQFADHAAVARGFGMHAERVEKPEDLADALARAFANRPALLDVVVTPEAVSSDARSGLAWVPDMQPLAAWDEAERAWRNSNESAGKAR
jgi:acetolactate synthase-1/2/3 large subunit